MSVDKPPALVKGNIGASQQAEPLLLTAALELAEIKGYVLPLYGVGMDGSCRCGKVDCNSLGKHPIVKGGVHSATTRGETIRDWWKQWPDANIGLATGSKSDIFVLDIDGPEGEKSLEQLEAMHGELPHTWTVITGRGQHLYFKWPKERQVKNSAHDLGKGLDIRGEGGYVVAPPSLHHSGKRYEWNEDDVDLADPPEWLLNLITDKKSPKISKYACSPLTVAPGGNEIIPAGERNTTLTRIAGSLRARGRTEEEIVEDISRINHLRCKEPLLEEEIETIAHSVARYPVDPRNLECAQQIVSRLIAAPVQDQTVFFEEETLTALATVRKNDAKLWAKFKPHAKGSVRDIKKAIRGLNLRAVEESEEPPTIAEILGNLDITAPEGCDDLLLPRGYYCGQEGLFKLGKGEESPPVKVCSVPILITGKTVDLHTGMQSFKLQYIEGERWREITGPAAQVVDKNQVVKLADQGLPVGSSNSKYIAEYFRNFADENSERLPTEKTSGKLGWMNDRCTSFLLGTEQIQEPDSKRITFKAEDTGENQVTRGICQQGTWEGWLDSVKSVTQYPFAMLALYGALAAPFLKALGRKSIGIDFAGRTSTGKTSLLSLAASVLGDPLVVMCSWDLTRVGLERRAALLCDLPLIIDDTARANPRLLDHFVYEVINGFGRGRGSIKGTRRTDTWRTVLISSGESPITSFGKAAGTRARILTIRGLPFGKADSDTRKIVDNLNFGLSLHFGHAMPLLIKALVSRSDDLEKIREAYSERKKCLVANSGAEARLADAAAVISVAGRLAHEWLGLPWEYSDPVKTLWQDIQKEAQEVDVDLRALRDVVPWLYANQEFFYNEATQPLTINGGTMGRWDHLGRWDEVAIYPHRLKEFLAREGYQLEAVIKGWKDRGWLRHEKDRDTARVCSGKATPEREAEEQATNKRNRHKVVKWDNTKQCRMYVLKREAMEANE